MNENLTRSSTINEIKPLLTCKSTPRTGDDEIPGSYCPSRHIWIHEGRPLVEEKSSLSELSTKTEAQIESDDTSPTFSALEMQTKTLSQAERDDQEFTYALIELSTKTKTVNERDD